MHIYRVILEYSAGKRNNNKTGHTCSPRSPLTPWNTSVNVQMHIYRVILEYSAGKRNNNKTGHSRSPLTPENALIWSVYRCIHRVQMRITGDPQSVQLENNNNNEIGHPNHGGSQDGKGRKTARSDLPQKERSHVENRTLLHSRSRFLGDFRRE